ncbi:hypothetical protein D9758_013899 [Tetrapyrgos nigripes]|uniref:ubiquitinyl hydrolase 1 n=1 Tax=Tetrapyrgos nigripes TaxID=182062 RepID=A0A8H5CMK3_9AGAR|nr:hypothetical protein D9758_013899 [Tetrapyrgos nigripes]
MHAEVVELSAATSVPVVTCQFCHLPSCYPLNTICDAHYPGNLVYRLQGYSKSDSSHPLFDLPVMSELEYIIHHVFVPPKLPQNDDYTIENEHFLCENILKSFKGFVKEQGRSGNQSWLEMETMLEAISESQQSESLSASKIEASFSTMHRGSVRAFLIRAQNAGVIVRKLSGHVVVESFEVTPPREVVMQGEGKILRTFPGPAISIPNGSFDDPYFDSPYFRQEFSSFLAQMNSDVLDSVATTQKAGSTVVEEKDSPHPRYITTLLTGILRGIGKPAEVTRICKRMTDEVLMDGKGKPWRRSMIWLVLRVALQTSFPEYKVFMIHFMLDTLEQAIQAKCDSELLLCMSIKIAARVHKLQDSIPGPLVARANTVTSRMHNLCSRRWKEVQDAQAQLLLWDPEVLRSNARSDTILSLKNSRDFLTRVLDNKDASLSPSSFTPNHAPRPLRNLQAFERYSDKSTLEDALSTDKSLALADLELSLQRNLKVWVFQHLTDSDAPGVLFNIFMVYLTISRGHYDENQEDVSIMMLTLLELWVALDKVAVAAHPLLADYSPEVPTELFQPLLLRKGSFIEQLIRLLGYIRDRHSHATRGTVFTDSAGFSSFAVRFFNESVTLQRLKKTIEDDAGRQRDAKREEYRRLRSEYSELVSKARRLSCTYYEYEDRWGCRRRSHSSSCEKCALERSADRLEIYVHEWPLPEDNIMAMVSVFELNCPDAFNCWREATYTFLNDLCMSSEESGRRQVQSQIYDKVYSYIGLEQWKGLNGNRERRITLGSDTASFKRTKYVHIKISKAVSEDNVIVNNGLRYKLYDKNTDKWATDPFHKLDITSMCILQLSPGIYSSLQFSLNSTSYTPNSVISNQYHCHDQLSLHEFIPFGSLRCGHRLQWLNMLKELRARNLTFYKEDVHLLLAQAAWQIGSVSPSNALEWHEDLLCPHFSRSFIEELTQLLNDISSNWMELPTARSIILLCCRLLEGSESKEVRKNIYTLLRSARETTFGWLKSFASEEQPIGQDPARVLERQRIICEMAFACRSTYDVDRCHLKSLMISSEDVSVFLECSVRLFDNTPASWKALPLSLQRLHLRDRRLSHFVEPLLLSRIKGDKQGVDWAISAIWPAYRPGMPWRALDHPNERWLGSSTRRQAVSSSQVVHLNILEGRMLIDGKPLSRLPTSITEHSTFIRSFGSRVLDIIPSDSGLDYATRSTILGYQLHFSLRNSDLIVLAKDLEGNRVLRLIPHHVLSGDFPELLVQENVHWLDLERNELEFRPLASLWTASSKNWKVQFVPNEASAAIQENSPADLTLVDVCSSTFHMISDRLRPLEHSRYLTITRTTTKRLQVDLPRFRLSFYLNEAGELECVNLPGMVVDRVQSIGTLVGLKSMLVLCSSKLYGLSRTEKSSISSQPQRVLIPDGHIRFSTKDKEHHVEISIDTPSRHARFYEYTVRTDIGCLEGDGGLRSHFYRAYLHAVTSHCLPDPLTRRTGTHESLVILASARSLSFQNVQSEDLQILCRIQALTAKRTFYPPNITIMQAIEWNDLPVLSQHPSFIFTVQDILAYCERLSEVRGERVSPESSEGHTDRLVKRDLYRNFRCYAKSGLRVEDTGRTTMDYSYNARDMELHDEKRIFEVSSSVSSGIPSPRVKLMDILRRWSNYGSFQGPHGSSPLTSASSLSYSCDWFSDALLSENWLTLYNLCRDPTVCWARKRYQLIFSLSALAYTNMSSEEADCHGLIPVLVQFAHDTRFGGISPPPHSSYILSDGIEPTRKQVQELLESSCKPFEDTPSADLVRQWREEEYDYEKRRQKDYNQERRLAVKAVTRYLLNQWPLTANSLSGPSKSAVPRVTLLRSRYLQDATELFRSCRRNGELTTHIDTIQAILDSTMRVESAPAVGYMVKSLDRRLRSHIPLPTLKGLLRLREPPGLGSANFAGLKALVSHLASPQDAVHQRFSRDLDQSAKALASRQSAVPYDNSGLLPYDGESFRLYVEKCLTEMENFYNLITSVLLPSVEGVERLLATTGLWPSMTPHTLLRLLSFDQRGQLGPEWVDSIQNYGKSIIQYQRSMRLQYLHCVNDPDGVRKEMDNDRPIGLNDVDWLLIQITGNFLARDIQVQVAREMMNPSNSANSVLQLNMGEGKSSVIVPMIATSLSDGNKLVRVIVLKALSPQMFQLLVDRVSGLANRRVFYMPFSRDLKVDINLTKRIQDLYQECMREGGVLVVQPEHVLSFRLMGLDRLVSRQPGVLDAVSQNLLDSHRWLCQHSRDILDESDEILHSRYQLIYTAGKQSLLENHPNRWIMVQDIFTLLLRHAKDVQCLFPRGVHVRDASSGEFPIIQIMEPDAEEELLSRIMKSIMQEGRLSSYAFERLPQELKEESYIFIRRRDVDQSQLPRLLHYCQETAIWKALLLLRGLFAHGVLSHVLKQRRWRVDYGLDQRRTLLAVPYRAKDVPSLRAEFGHPDVAICLTYLSYYYGGLTPGQLDSCFEILMKSDNPSAEYAQWAQNTSPNVPTNLSGVNLKDPAQRLDVIIPHLSRNRSVINFFLSHIVFPKYAKEFPKKLTTCGWDLAEAKTYVTTGFSGTKDSQWLLPTTISQCDPLNQEATNAQVLSYLLQPENNQYHCAKGPDNENLLAEDFLKLIVSQPLQIRVLLDVGAQILDLVNKQVAKKWLLLHDDASVSAAVFFDEGDRLMVIDRQDNVEPLMSSQFKGQLGKCLVYLDDAHTRGTDLKLPREYRAAVTLGLKVTKDRLAQGCMRMRKLGHGQSVTFFAPFDIDQKIRHNAGLDAQTPVSSCDVLKWACEETIAEIQHYGPHWLKQGIDYIERKKAWDTFNSSLNSSDLSPWLQREAQTLEEMYGIGDKENTFQHVDFRTEEYRELDERCQKLGWSLAQSVSQTSVDEEQEREVANEIEVERQVQRPPRKHPETHHIDPEVERFLQNGIIPASAQSKSFIPLFRYLPVPSIPNRRVWSPGLLCTVDFARTIKGLEPAIDDYMRPVTWIVSGGHLADSTPALVVISPYEANKLRSNIARNTAGLHLHLYAPRVTQSQRSFEDLDFHVIPPLPPSWKPPGRRMIIQLNLFAGQLYLRDWKTYEELCAFLGLYLPSQDASERAVYQSDGFVKSEHRNGDMQLLCPFQSSPLPALIELFGSRRKGSGYSLTHIGKIVRGRILVQEDFLNDEI